MKVTLTTQQKDSLKVMGYDLHTDLSGVIQQSLGLLERCVNERKKGNNISITKDGKVLKEIVGIF